MFHIVDKVIAALVCTSKEYKMTDSSPFLPEQNIEKGKFALGAADFSWTPVLLCPKAMGIIAW